MRNARSNWPARASTVADAGVRNIETVKFTVFWMRISNQAVSKLVVVEYLSRRMLNYRYLWFNIAWRAKRGPALKNVTVDTCLWSRRTIEPFERSTLSVHLWRILAWKTHARALARRSYTFRGADELWHCDSWISAAMGLLEWVCCAERGVPWNPWNHG